jgi:predicted small secreted protein
MMTRKCLAIACVVLLVVSLAGCATESGYYDPARSAGAGALGGAATGAALGAIIGAATGNAATGAWVGAASGALIGGVGAALYASHRNSEIRSAEAAAQSRGYQGQGYVVSVDNVTASPGMASPGQQVMLGADYTILTPDNQPVSATLEREIRYGGNLVGSPYQTTVTNSNGGFNDTVTYSLPNNATPGVYTVVTRLSSSYGTSQREASFSVQ